jgi:MFS family permease
MERNIKLLAAFNFFTDFKLHSAILILYFTKVTGSYALGMSLFSMTMLSSALFEIPTGTYSDLIGRKNTIMLGSLFAIASAIFYAIGMNYWILFTGAIFEGMTRSFYSGNNDAFLHDSLASLNKKEYYSHYLGKVSAMFQAALTVGAVIGAIVANWSYAWVMWLTVIPQSMCFIISLYLQEPQKVFKIQSNIFSHISSAFKLLWKNKKLRILNAAQVLGFGVGESAFQFRSAFIATLWPIWAIGFSKMLSFIGGGISFWFSGKLINKFGESKLLFFESIYNRTVNLFSVIFPSIASPAIMATTSFLYGATDVASNSLMQKEFTSNERATLSSLTSLESSIFFGVFSIVLGFIADIFSPVKALLFAEICSIPRAYLLWKLHTEKKYI